MLVGAVERLRAALESCPIVASAQASPGSPLQDVSTLRQLAQASLQQGCTVLRMQGAEAIAAARSIHDGPLIGLIKRDYPGSEVYITPTAREVDEALDAGADIVALDATDRPRPGGESLENLVGQIHGRGAAAMADCDSLDSMRFAAQAGCRVFSTTLAGYTSARAATPGPDLDLLRAFAAGAPGLVLAEGRFQEPWQAAAALRCGAHGVVVGGALNDPVKQSRRFVQGSRPRASRVGAVDLGGTWLRFAVVSSSLEIESLERIPTPGDRTSRMAWLLERAKASGAGLVGVSAGGTVDPRTGEVWEAKDFIPQYLGSAFADPALRMFALNDGLATAWGHAQRPQWAGRRVAALALGTGVGAGLVDRGKILHGPRGEYPRFNDLPLPGGGTVEEALGGLALSADPAPAMKDRAIEAAKFVASAMNRLWMPDVIVVSGGVGLSSWMREALAGWDGPLDWGAQESGLFGAAALALFPQAEG